MSAYLMRLVCAAILCSLVDAVVSSGAAGGGMRRLTAAVFLTLVAFSLPTELALPELDPDRFFREAEQAVAQGEAHARDARAECIIESCEAYVWSKAEDLGLEVSVEIILDEQLQPCRVKLSGAASPLQQQELCDALCTELGMGEEDVLWIQSYQSSE